MSSFKVDSLTGITGIIYLEPLNYRKLILTRVCVHFQKFTGLLPIIPFIHSSIFQATCHTVYRVTGCWAYSSVLDHINDSLLKTDKTVLQCKHNTSRYQKDLLHLCKLCLRMNLSRRSQITRSNGTRGGQNVQKMQSYFCWALQDVQHQEQQESTRKWDWHTAI